MEQIVTGEQMKALDVYTIEQMQMPSLVLMEQAGLQVFGACKKKGCHFLKCWFYVAGDGPTGRMVVGQASDPGGI